MITDVCDTEKRDVSSYPGGKSGSGVYQRLINLIPPHRVLIVPFAGHCGVVRNIKPAEHTVVIDQDEKVCEWWLNWSRTKRGRALEIHHCDGIEWLRFLFGVTKYSDAEACDAHSGSRCRSTKRLVMDCDRKSQNQASAAGDDELRGTRAATNSAAEAFIFADPPYVISQRSCKDEIYDCELDDSDHVRFTGTVTRIDATRAQIMVCGYANCALYRDLDLRWLSIDHRVPTRRGLQDERIWLNYEKPTRLHDYQYIGNGRRSRERIRRRQRNWIKALKRMNETERLAMLAAVLDL